MHHDTTIKEHYNIYCDESCHLENDDSKSMVIGGIWCKTAETKEIATRIKEIRTKHHLDSNFEIKWNKVSPSKLPFYLDLIDYFFDNQSLHFRGVVIPDKTVLDHAAHNQTHDDFYYKIYFQMIEVILEPSGAYFIYLDIKDTRSQHKVVALKDILRTSRYDYNKEIVKRVQQIRANEVVILQLTDLLIGALSYLHRGLDTSNAKKAIIERIKERSNYTLLNTTLFKEPKVNLLVWRSNG